MMSGKFVSKYDGIVIKDPLSIEVLLVLCSIPHLQGLKFLLLSIGYATLAHESFSYYGFGGI